MGDGSGGFITRHGALALVGAVPAQNRKNNWIWNRSLVFPCTSYIYLVFALPFEETYCEENKLRAAYTEGVYGLCRHPGVLWFAGAYLCMWGMFGGWKQGIYFLLYEFFGIICISFFRILWTFPQTFLIIENIRKTLPFLIPNKESIQACFYSVRKQ